MPVFDWNEGSAAVGFVDEGAFFEDGVGPDVFVAVVFLVLGAVGRELFLDIILRNDKGIKTRGALNCLSRFQILFPDPLAAFWTLYFHFAGYIAIF